MINSEIRYLLRKIVGKEYCIVDVDEVALFLYDETERFLRPQASQECVVVKPENEQEIAEIVKIANSESIPVVVRGGGTGLCGAAIPTYPSIIISMERMNRIVAIDEKNFMIKVQSGITLKGMNALLNQRVNLYFPAKLGEDTAQVGGLVAQNAGGAKVGKHGVMRNNVKGMRVVLSSGDIVSFGGSLKKNNAGYDLMQLMIGSEGTLGIITEVTLQLFSKTNFNSGILVSFDSYTEATEVVNRILRKGITPLTIEYLDRSIAMRTAEYLGEEWPLEKGEVFLLFELSEKNEAELFNASVGIEEVCSRMGVVDYIVLNSIKERNRILEIRSNTYHATKNLLVDSLDISVPPAEIPNLMKHFNHIARKYNAIIDTVGHVGDGNVHNNIYLKNGEVPEYYEDMKVELYQIAISIGGSITGEHGIGKIRNKNLKMQLSKEEIELMRGLKQLFDPKGIMNPDTAIY
ncbi:FAD-binding oxidoreductase [Anaerovorax sp. IOR16]|uniref:FAD-binding oxidoreductase n=1 Tax=Anaerovorax sp. IOR16 TaxID=2773458 RepID=UPI0019D21A25|nr:FAD-binding oxidoreductase [Anaerovorax sp. IOR16]